MTYERTGNSERPDFDQELAESYVGSYILIGVTYFDHHGRELECVQMHGVVESVGPDGLHIALRGNREGERWLMPPVPDAIQRADPGVYTLHATGEVIENPDLISTWNVTKPCQH